MNKYEVLGLIDEGAYGTVLKASLRDTGGLVAIKKFKESDDDPVVRGPIQRQIRMLKALRSDFVVDLKQAFRKKGKVYLVFQYMEKNLLHLIEDHPSGIPLDIVQRLTYQMARCINFLHSKEVVHRDLKPQNLLISSKLVLKLCDFGFTRVISNYDDDLTDYVATRWYRSPELLVGQAYGKPLDMWSIGCIVYEMITGQPLFPGENEIDQLHLIKKTFGELTIEQNIKINTNQRFIGVKFPQIRKLDSIQSKLQHKASKNAIQFIKDCLKIDPNQRLTAAKALEHPYFSNLAVNFKHQMPTERRQFTAPVKHQGGYLDKTVRMKTIYGSKSNQNLFKFAGARHDATKYQNNLINPKSEMPQLQITTKPLNVASNNGTPELNQSPLKTTIKNKGKLIGRDENCNPPKKNIFRLSHFKMKSLISMPNKYELSHQFKTNSHLNFSISGQTKSILKKL